MKVAVSVYALLMALLWPYVCDAADKAPPPAPPVADEALQQARTHFEAGRNAYNAQDYVTAIREFKAAEALRPSPILAYNIGLANEKLAKKRVAVKYYHRYLEQLPNAQNRAEVEGRIAQLEKELAAQPPPPTAPPGQAAPVVEQPGDLPPTTAPPQTGSDIYGSTAPHSPPPAPPAQKKKSHWWVWLLVAGGATIVLAVIIAVAVVYGDTTNVPAFDRAMLTNVRDPQMYERRTSSKLLPIAHF